MGRRQSEVPAPRPVVETELRVRYAETDAMGIAHHTSYFVWFEVGRTEYTRAVKLPYREVERNGLRLVVVEAYARFHRPARYDDLVVIRTTLREVSRATLTFAYRSCCGRTTPCSWTGTRSTLPQIYTGECNGSLGMFAQRWWAGEEPLCRCRTSLTPELPQERAP